MTEDRINDQYQPTYVAYVSTGDESGGKEVYFDGPDDLAAFNRDPDGYAAAMFDLSRDDYREWVTLHGVPLCGCITKAGRLCSKATWPFGQDALRWKQKHRRFACPYHQRNGNPVVSP